MISFVVIKIQVISFLLQWLALSTTFYFYVNDYKVKDNKSNKYFGEKDPLPDEIIVAARQALNWTVLGSRPPGDSGEYLLSYVIFNKKIRSDSNYRHIIMNHDCLKLIIQLINHS